MKKPLPVLFLLAAMTVSAAQKTPPAKAKLPAAPATPFDLSWERIPASFHPNSFDAVFRAKTVKPKGEFETDEQFISRMPSSDSRIYAFSVVAEEFVYDANAKAFKVPSFYHNTSTIMELTSDNQPASTTNKGFLIVRTGEVITSGKPYVAQNAFGASTIVHTKRHAVTGIRYDHYYSPHKDLFIEMEPEEAKRSKLALGVLAVAHLDDGFDGSFTFFGYDSAKATMDDPEQIYWNYHLLSADSVTLVIYNKNTGKIYMKQALTKAGQQKPAVPAQ